MNLNQLNVNGRVMQLPTIEDSGSHSMSEESFSTQTNTKDGHNVVDGEALAARENLVICCLRLIVITVIILAATLIAISVYVISKNVQEVEFENQFQSEAQQLIEDFNSSMIVNLGLLESFSVSLTSYAKDRGLLWPQVTLPDFAARASTAIASARAISLLLIPVVSTSGRRTWEQYSVANSEWIEASLAFENQTNVVYGGTRPGRRLQYSNGPDFSKGFSSNIYMDAELSSNGRATILPEIENSSGPYFPIWQHANVAPVLVNYDLNSNVNFTDSLQACYKSNKAVISSVEGLGISGPLASSTLQVWEAQAVVNAADTFNIIYFPVFDSFQSGKNLVAILALVTDWSTFFEYALPDGSNGMYVVITNTCDQNYTYYMTGPKAHFVGKGDFHDTQYNFLEQSLPLDIVRKGTPLDMAHCRYALRVYPSGEFRDAYMTNKPAIYTIGAVMVILVAIVAFLAYDCVVERRNRIVMKTAVENKAVVASLFPSAVRERLFMKGNEKEDRKKVLERGVSSARLTLGGTTVSGKENWDTKGSKGALGLLSESAPLRIKNFLNDSLEPAKMPGEKPIADLFPNCTVFFADIAGFTAWSSQREPTHVFQLLQTLYGCFDRIARKLGVFKSKDHISLSLTYHRFCNSMSCLFFASRNYRRLLRCCHWSPRSTGG